MRRDVGLFERFDVSFDARRIVFAHRAARNVGHRIYEINVDGTGPRQLTFPPPDEAERMPPKRQNTDKYKANGNLVMNVGSLAAGELDPREADRILRVGQWLERNGEAISGWAASSSTSRLTATHVRSADTLVRPCRRGYPQADRSVRAPGEPSNGSLMQAWISGARVIFGSPKMTGQFNRIARNRHESE